MELNRMVQVTRSLIRPISEVIGNHPLRQLDPEHYNQLLRPLTGNQVGLTQAYGPEIALNRMNIATTNLVKPLPPLPASPLSSRMSLFGRLAQVASKINPTALAVVLGVAAVAGVGYGLYKFFNPSKEVEVGKIESADETNLGPSRGFLRTDLHRGSDILVKRFNSLYVPSLFK